ncbi:serine/threonine-protein kinase [Streptomyces sp. NPDC002643]
MRLGTTVGGRYRLTRGPFDGGMGEVWLARDLKLPREVVLKRSRLPDAGAEGFDRLQAEGRAQVHAGHAHVVTLHDVLPLPDGSSWLVMEYVSGGSLDGRPPLSPERAARVGSQIAAALTALHAKRIVHGDIKPANIVVTPEGLAKLADFGAAYRAGGDDTITPNGRVSYTPDYAAPEAVTGRPEPASDIFSLACALHALVTGHPPRPGADDDEDSYNPFLAQRMAERGDWEVTGDTGVLAPVLPAMLARDPGDRPDATEVQRLLERIAGPQTPLPPAVGKGAEQREAEGEASEEKGAEGRAGERRGAEGASGVGDSRGGSDVSRRHGLAALLPSRPGALSAVLGVGALSLVLVLVVALVLAGGDDTGSTGGGTPSGSAAPSTAPRASSTPTGGPPGTVTDTDSVFGDPRTADLCALADASALKRFGEAELDRDYGNFDRCDVLVDTGDEGTVHVKFWYDTGGPSELAVPTRTVGAVRVVDEDDDSDACVKALLPVGDPEVVVEVIAQAEDSEGDPPLCGIAEAATAYAVEELNRGRLPRRSPTAAEDSLIHQDACTLLSASDLEAIPGIDARDPEIGFGNWDCEWESTTNDLWAELRFDRDQPPTAADGALTRIGGRTAVIEPDEEGDDTCRIRVVHRAYVHDGESMVETLNVTVGGDPSAERLRRLATELAAAAITRAATR